MIEGVPNVILVCTISSLYLGTVTVCRATLLDSLLSFCVLYLLGPLVLPKAPFLLERFRYR